MIHRIYRIRIRPDSRPDFERDFLKVAVGYVEGRPGLLSYVVGFPSRWSPDDYMLTTVWENEAALIKFAGDNWDIATYPDGMEHYVLKSWLDHFTAPELAREISP